MSGSITSTTIQAMKVARDAFRTISTNVARSEDTNASESIREISTINGSNGDVLGLRSHERRSENPALAQVIRTEASHFAKTAVIQDTFIALEAVIGDPAQPQKSKLYGAIDTFVSAAMSLSSNNDPSVRQAFVTKGQDLATSLSLVSEKITELRFQADQDIGDSIVAANGVIKSIFEVNRALGSSGGGSISLKDQRDALLRELATYCDINVSFGAQGQAYASDARGSHALVGNSSYGQLGYKGLASPSDLIAGAEINPITLTHYRADGTKVDTHNVVDRGVNILSGGKLEGLREIRDSQLVDSYKAVGSLIKTVADSVNAIHNNYSTFPPKTTLTSERKLGMLDATNWSGSFKVVPMDTNGRSLDGNSGIVRPITVDLENLPSSNGTVGRPTTADIIKELNEMLSTDQASPRLALGPIIGANPQEYLLNNIRIAGRSDIVNGSFTFDLDLDGNNYFGSSVQVMSVIRDPGGANELSADFLPEFRLEKGVHARSNQAITVNNLMGGPNTVRVELRVIGDNGQVSEGHADFIIDPAQGAKMTNVRISYDPNVAPVGMVTPGNNTHSSLATVSLMNEFGGAIDPTDTLTKGNLVIEGGLGIALLIEDDGSKDNGLGTAEEPVNATGRGLGHYFGFNNFFTLDDVNNTMSVRPDILANVSNLSVGRPGSEISGLAIAVPVGQVKASITLAFTAGQQPNAADTVTINGTVFDFGGLGGRSVVMGGNLQATLGNLVNAINTDAYLSPIMQASIVGDTITIEAKQAGVGGNGFTFASNLGAGGSLATVSVNGGGAANNAGGNFAGGVDAIQNISIPHSGIGFNSTNGLEALADLRDATFEIGATSLVPASSNTLRGYAAFVSGAVLKQVVDVKRDAKVAEAVVTTLNTEYKSKHGISKEDQELKIMDWTEYFQANTVVWARIQRTNEEVLRIISAA